MKQFTVAAVIAFILALMVQAAQAGTTIKNIIDTETGLLIGQTWTDDESGDTDYVYVDKTDRQLFVVNQGRYEELVRNKVVGATTDNVIVHMGDLPSITMSTADFITASGGSSFEEAVSIRDAMLNGDNGGVNKDDHMVEREIKTQVDRQSSMKLTPAMTAKLNAKIKQYNEGQ